MMPSSSAMNWPAHAARRLHHLGVIQRLVGSTPAAMFVMHEMPSTSMPMWRATIASGTVDMPTASAPIVRR